MTAMVIPMAEWPTISMTIRGVNPEREQQRHAGVAHVVEPDAAEAARGAEVDEEPGHVGRFQRRAGIVVTT